MPIKNLKLDPKKIQLLEWDYFNSTLNYVVLSPKF